MPPAFDVYHKWLGIPPAEQPPHHYRLLGVNPFEDDRDVIELAADQRMVHLRTFQNGQYSEQSQKLLNQVAAAKLCLLRPDRKAAYDAELRKSLQPQSLPAFAPVPLPAAQSAILPAAEAAPAPAASGEWQSEGLGFDPTPRFRASKSGGQRKSSNLQLLLFIGPVAAIVVVIGAVWSSNQQDAAPDPESNRAGRATEGPNRVPQPEPLKSATAGGPKSIAVNGSGKSASGAGSVPANSIAGVKGPVAVPEVGSVLPLKVDPSVPEPVLFTPDGGPKPAGPSVPAGNSGPPAKRLPIPSATDQRKSLDQLKELLKDDYARAVNLEGKIALSGKLVKLANETSNDPLARYVLAHEAVDIASKIGEVQMSSEMVGLLIKNYEVDKWDIGPATLLQLSRSARTPDARHFIAGAAVDMADAALKEEQYDVAADLSDAAALLAAGGGDMALRDRAKEARDKAHWVDKAWGEISAAEAKLRTDPNDPAANLTVGRFRCLYQQNWEQGLPLLARGGDEPLQAVAKKELAAPASPQDQVALGDSWWDIPDKDGQTRKAIQARAVYWYRLALPNLSGLGAAKLQQRIDEADLAKTESVFLDDLKEQVSSVGYGAIGKHGATGYPNTNGEPQDIEFHGARPTHALSIHPPIKGVGFATYQLDGRYRMFSSLAGLRDYKIPSESPLIFKVFGDGRLLWTSRPLQRASSGAECSVQIQGIKELRLEVFCPGSNIHAHAVWINPQLSR